MIEPNAAEIELLREACRSRVVRVKIAGKVQDEAAEHERCKCANVLEHAGYFEPLPQDGAYARWRIKPALSDQVAALLKP